MRTQPSCSHVVLIIVFMFSEAQNKLRAVEHALDDLEKSDTFKQLLRIILAVGNYLNAGTQKGQAFGFKLGSLRMLDSTKTSDNSKTLLQVGVVSSCRTS